MALVPYTITAIERDTADADASGKQVVVGAVCSMFLQPSDTVVLMYDNADGDNGNTAKLTGANGQVTVWIETGDYRVSVNGQDNYISLKFNDEKISIKPMSVIRDIISNVDSKVVITGDSISYNHQDLDAVSRNSGDVCNPGMRSWSFMLGDIIHRQDDFFKHIDELEVERFGVSSLELYNNASATQVIPFGGRVLTFSGVESESPVLTIKYKHQGRENKAYFLMIGSPTDKSCTFSVSVDGVTSLTGVTNKLSTSLYLGRDLRQIEIPVPNDGLEHTIRFFNFIQNADVPDVSGTVFLDLVGMSSKNTRVDINGVSGFNTADLLTQWTARVVNKQPDVLMILLGANDSFDGLPIESFKINLTSMIDQARAVKPNCEVVLMSTPGTTEGNPFSVPDDVALKYVNAMQEVSESKRTHFVNLFDLFSLSQPSNFRFDWVHLNRGGNTSLCKTIADSMGLSYDKQDVDTYFSLINGAEFNVKKIPGSTLIASPTGTGTNPKIYGIAKKQGQNFVVKSAISTDGETVRVEFNYLLKRLGTVSVRPWGFISTLMTPVQTNSGADFLEFKVVKSDNTLAQHADYITNANDFSFIIDYVGS